MKKYLLLLPLFFVGLVSIAQKKQYKSAIVGFYNLENLFDTIDNTLINDEEFLPNGIRNYNTTIYRDKLAKLAAVIAQMGAAYSPDGPALLGVAEIENDTVLKDLVNEPQIQKRNYRYVHYDSKDARGGGGATGVRRVQQYSGSGGSGFAILRFAGSYTAAATTGSPDRREGGGYTYYTWTGNGSITI